MLAGAADAGICPDNYLGDAYYTLGTVIEAATHKLGETVFSSDK